MFSLGTVGGILLWAIGVEGDSIGQTTEQENWALTDQRNAIVHSVQ